MFPSTLLSKTNGDEITKKTVESKNVRKRKLIKHLKYNPKNVVFSTKKN